MPKVLTAVEVFHPERMLSAYSSNKLMSWVQDCLSTGHKTLLIDFQYAPFIDGTGVEVLANVGWLVKEWGGEVFLASVRG
jgi:anti-anti-sigma regulatory factor